MDAQQQRLEVQAIGSRDDDLAVKDAALRQPLPQWRGELREVPIERLEVAALEQDLVAVAEADRPEAVPLGLEQPAIARGQAVAMAWPAWAPGAARPVVAWATIPGCGSRGPDRW